MSNNSSAFDAPQEYKHFRILILGNAGAGKTTLLKRVCNLNTIEELDKKKDVRRALTFASKPGFIFHVSPGIETGDDTELKKVEQFIDECANATDVNDQLHAIWFCLRLNPARAFLELENQFFNKMQHENVPMVVILTKFDDLISQFYDIYIDEDENRVLAKEIVKKDFEVPLSKCGFPPRAQVVLEDMHNDNMNHQDKVEELTRKTADSIDNSALKELFVSLTSASGESTPLV